MNNKTTTFGGQGIWLLNKVVVPVTMFALLFFLLTSCGKDKNAAIKKDSTDILTESKWKPTLLEYMNKDSVWSSVPLRHRDSVSVFSFFRDSTVVTTNTETQTSDLAYWKFLNNSSEIQFMENDHTLASWYNVLSLGDKKFVVRLHGSGYMYVSDIRDNLVKVFGKRQTFIAL